MFYPNGSGNEYHPKMSLMNPRTRGGGAYGGVAPVFADGRGHAISNDADNAYTSADAVEPTGYSQGQAPVLASPLYQSQQQLYDAQPAGYKNHTPSPLFYESVRRNNAVKDSERLARYQSLAQSSDAAQQPAAPATSGPAAGTAYDSPLMSQSLQQYNPAVAAATGIYSPPPTGYRNIGGNQTPVPANQPVPATRPVTLGDVPTSQPVGGLNDAAGGQMLYSGPPQGARPTSLPTQASMIQDYQQAGSPTNNSVGTGQVFSSSPRPTHPNALAGSSISPDGRTQTIRSYSSFAGEAGTPGMSLNSAVAAEQQRQRGITAMENRGIRGPASNNMTVVDGQPMYGLPAGTGYGGTQGTPGRVDPSTITTRTFQRVDPNSPNEQARRKADWAQRIAGAQTAKDFGDANGDVNTPPVTQAYRSQQDYIDSLAAKNYGTTQAAIDRAGAAGVAAGAQDKNADTRKNLAGHQGEYYDAQGNYLDAKGQAIPSQIAANQGRANRDNSAANLTNLQAADPERYQKRPQGRDYSQQDLRGIYTSAKANRDRSTMQWASQAMKDLFQQQQSAKGGQPGANPTTQPAATTQPTQPQYASPDRQRNEDARQREKDAKQGATTRPASGEQPPRVTSQAQYDELPSGARYIGSNGSILQKK